MPRFLKALAPALLALPTVGCMGNDDRPVEVVAIGDPQSLFSAEAKMPFSARLLRAATVEGLVSFDEKGNVVPALADRWIVTDDGLSYIFRLRDGTWSQGEPITAETARTALQQAISAQRGQALGADLAVIEDIKAMAGRVIEIRLRQPMPDFLQLLAQPELGLVYARRGAGPMTAKRATDRDLRLQGMLLHAIAPEDRGLVPEEGWDQRVRNLRISAAPAARAIELFAAGKVDVVLGGNFADYPRIDKAGISQGAVRFDPVFGLFGLAVTRTDGFLSLPENREAIAMAVDREALANLIGLNSWTATTRVVNPGLDGDTGTVVERWPGQSIAERQAVAAGRVARWKAAKHSLNPLRIALPEGPGNDLLFEQLAHDFKAIGLEARRVGLNDTADLRLFDTVARYAAPAWFLNQLSCGTSPAACSPNADLTAKKALIEPDPAKRADLYADAEAQLTQANSFIPFGVPVRWSLVGSGVNGYAPNRWGLHPLMPMAMLPK